MSTLCELIYASFNKEWGDSAFKILKEFAETRYGKRWEKRIQIRVNGNTTEDAAPYAAYIPAGQPKSGPYGGMSFVLCPSPDSPALVALVVGTNGLSPDEQSLGRPGHARKSNAIIRWITKNSISGIAWSKRDPVRIDQGMPKQLKAELEAYEAAIEKYERVIYSCFLPQQKGNGAEAHTERAAVALCDLFAEEHNLPPLTTFQREAKACRDEWLSCVLPTISRDEVMAVLKNRRFVILEGPPGTGKTRMAQEILRVCFNKRGRSIQFHPGTTYENFIGGLSPVTTSSELGLRFQPQRGHLLAAAAEAANDKGNDYLLHIDEINRADLAKILGEAVYLFEPLDKDRNVRLAYDFGAPFNSQVQLPPNLYVLGTMNSADRSIAILDLAIRRRFAFLTIWPDPQVLEQNDASLLAKEAFQRLFSLFLEEATDEAFVLMPGHAYFLDGGDNTKMLLKTGLKPLLSEYLQQGYVSSFADEIRAYQEWLDAQIEK